LMGRGQMPAAIAIFRLNSESYPKSFNVFDSLAEALMNAGNAKEAIANYRKSLELNPANANAIQMIRKLEVE
ncbi:MAG: tetratricopeptide repeat protein, partial [Rhodothermales bacterium]|nr:tetratricopeptide repeat protein [Rhodothermales bacterium]